MLCILDEAKDEILTNLMDLFEERIETGFDHGLHNFIITSKVVTQLKMILYDYIHPQRTLEKHPLLPSVSK